MISTAIRVPLCTLDDIPTGLGRPFEVGGQEIAVFRGRDGRVFAIEGRCPHKGGALADGMLIGDQVVCPLHAYRIHGTTGECEHDDLCPIETYPVEVRQGQVYVAVPVA